MSRLQPGQIAPTFDAVDVQGRPVLLRDLRGRKVHLSFFRNAACPLCNLRYFQLGDRIHEWTEKNLVSLAVFESPAETIQRNLRDLAAPLPLIADPDRQLYVLYGLETSWRRNVASFFFPVTYLRGATAYAKGLVRTPIEKGDTLERLPAEFLIDENGVIQRALYGGWMGHFLPFSVIEDFVQRSAEGPGSIPHPA